MVENVRVTKRTRMRLPLVAPLPLVFVLLLLLLLLLPVLCTKIIGARPSLSTILQQCKAQGSLVSTAVIGPRKLQALLNERTRGTVVLFFDPECPHYKRYSKAWECSARAAKLLGLNIELRRLDLTASSIGKSSDALQETGSLMLDLRVKASPTVVYYPPAFQVPNRQRAARRRDGQPYRGSEFVHLEEGQSVFEHNVRWFVAWASALAVKNLQDILGDVPATGAVSASATIKSESGEGETILAQSLFSSGKVSVSGESDF